jgi:phosphoglycerate dehydrogenase-like enzyme
MGVELAGKTLGIIGPAIGTGSQLRAFQIACRVTVRHPERAARRRMMDIDVLAELFRCTPAARCRNHQRRAAR